MTKFLLWCAGADVEILELLPTEKVKYQAIGSTILFTTVLAGFAGGYALYVVFQSFVWAFLFGVVWGIMILNWERYITASLVKREDARVLFMPAIPKILFSILIAIITAYSFGLIIFKEEINQKLLVLEIENQKIEARKADLEQAYRTKTQEIEAQVGKLKDEISAKEAEITQLEENLIDEIQGVRGRPGYGPVAAEIEKRIEMKQQQLEKKQHALAPFENRLEALRREHLTQKQQMEKSASELKVPNGLLARYNVLIQKSQENPTIKRSMYFIFALLFILYCQPVFIKLFSPRGAYDVILESSEKKALQQIGEYETQQSGNENIKRASQVKNRILWQASMREFSIASLLCVVVAIVFFIFTKNIQYSGLMALVTLLVASAPIAVDLYRKKQHQIYSNRIERNQKELLGRIDQDALTLLKKKGGYLDGVESESQ